jgi:type III secretion system HrpB4-like protein
MSPASAAPTSTTTPAATMILRILHAYQARLQGLPQWLDASAWGAQASGMPAASAKDWRQVCAALGVHQVGLPTLLSQAHRLAVLGAEDLRRVLAARVLLDRRGALARCIDGAYLAGVERLFGEPALAALTQRHDWAPDPGGPLPMLDLPLLAQAGLHALIAEGAVTDASLAQLMRLTIGMQAPASPDAGTSTAAPHAEAFMAALPVLFPELSWLFG